MRRTAGHRFSAAALAALWLVGPIATALHGASELHRYCDEHEAFEELAAAPADAPADAGRDASLRAPAAGGDADADHHDACPFASPSLLDRPPAPHLAARLAPPGDDAPALAADQRRTPVLPILAFAPKASPPALLA